LDTAYDESGPTEALELSTLLIANYNCSGSSFHKYRTITKLQKMLSAPVTSVFIAASHRRWPLLPR
jgi:hypothetical protein